MVLFSVVLVTVGLVMFGIATACAKVLPTLAAWLGFAVWSGAHD
jgi:hypothetical protein